jgi:hypothetical protein
LCQNHTRKSFDGKKKSLTAAFQVLHVGGEGGGDSDASEDAHDRCEDEHQTDHDSGEVDGGDTVQDDEDVVVVQLGKAVVDAGGEEEGQDLEIEVEGRPGKEVKNKIKYLKSLVSLSYVFLKLNFITN